MLHVYECKIDYNHDPNNLTRAHKMQQIIKLRQSIETIKRQSDDRILSRSFGLDEDDVIKR